MAENVLLAKSSRKARLSAARLAAVQAIYSRMATGQGAHEVIEDYETDRLGAPVEGQAMIQPDKALFGDIVAGVAARQAEIEAALTADPTQHIPAEPLLRAVMLCGTWELIATQTDAPIIIADYLNVTHAFFDQGEARLVNGTLDRIAKTVRSKR